MRTSSSLPTAIICFGLIGLLVMTAIAWPSLVAERAEASTEVDIVGQANIIDVTPAESLFPVYEPVQEVETPVVEAPAPAPAAAPVQPKKQVAGPLTPAHLSIPSAGMDKRVIGVGVNAKNEIDVPSGETENVGWYHDGAKPGGKGTAVMDAHVFAAFKNLDQVQVGADIYVADASGAELRFRVTKVQSYLLANLSPATLFSGFGSSGRYLNLITCTGTFSSALGTYDHRLIVFSELVQ